MMNPTRDWHQSLKAAVRDPDVLIDRLNLPEALRVAAHQAAEQFPLLVTESYLSKMRLGDPHDPLLLQVLPLHEEMQQVAGFSLDAVGDMQSHAAAGLLHKYEGRALMIATGACAVHCRYCFRRHFPYGDEPRRLDDWQPALDALANDDSIHEVILSGGDPLMLTDARLGEMIARIESIPHIQRLRLHSRLPIVLPDRVTDELLDLLDDTRLTSIMVVHANHPNEVADDCADALAQLVSAGVPTLNQAVLLRQVNDDVDVLADLCLRLVNLGVMPYYLHQLDRVHGTAHFEVSESRGMELIDELRTRLPGYAVPLFVRELPGGMSKKPIEGVAKR